MQNVSSNFVSQMGHHPYVAKVTLDDSKTIQGEPIQNINFRGGANGDSAGITMGCAIASSVEIFLDASQVTESFAQRKMKVELGQNVNGSVEWIPMGNYVVTDASEDDGTIKVTGMDEIAARMDAEYEDIPGFDFTSGEAIGSLDLARAICDRHGVSIDLSGLSSYDISGFLPYGSTDRQILGMIAGLYGKFAVMDRTGTVKFRWYQEVNVKITGDEYYEDGLDKAGFDFTVSWLKCYSEILEETMIRGNAEASQGIHFTCPWMTDDILDGIWNTVQGFQYTPVAGLSFLGDPRLDLGDVITLQNLAGETFRVPVTSIFHEFDGGLKTELSADGKANADVYEGPVQRETKRVQAKIIKKLDGIEMSVTNAEGDIASLKLTAEGLSTRVEDVQLQIDNDVETINRKFMELETSADGLASTVSKQTESINGIKDEMTQVQQKSDEIAFIVKNISDNGVDHVETKTGVYVRDDGVHVEREGDEVNAHLAHDGLRVNALDDARLIADVNGVDAYNLKAHNYLNIGHARFEAYGSDQTACFYV